MEKEETKKLTDIKREAKSCPFCGKNNISFTYTTNYGHGGIDFENARIICMDCSGSKGKGYGGGEPTELDEIKAYLSWNERLSERIFADNMEALTKELNDKLQTADSYFEISPKQSIMTYGVICDHDDGFLCEHRRQWIIDFLINTQKLNIK